MHSVIKNKFIISKVYHRKEQGIKPFELVAIPFINKRPVAEFKEFERRFKFKPRFKYGWFHLKLYQMFQDLNQRLI